MQNEGPINSTLPSVFLGYLFIFLPVNISMGTFLHVVPHPYYFSSHYSSIFLSYSICYKSVYILSVSLCFHLVCQPLFPSCLSASLHFVCQIHLSIVMSVSLLICLSIFLTVCPTVCLHTFPSSQLDIALTIKEIMIIY